MSEWISRRREAEKGGAMDRGGRGVWRPGWEFGAAGGGCWSGQAFVVCGPHAGKPTDRRGQRSMAGARGLTGTPRRGPNLPKQGLLVRCCRAAAGRWGGARKGGRLASGGLLCLLRRLAQRPYFMKLYLVLAQEQVSAVGQRHRSRGGEEKRAPSQNPDSRAQNADSDSHLSQKGRNGGRGSLRRGG